MSERKSHRLYFSVIVCIRKDFPLFRRAQHKFRLKIEIDNKIIFCIISELPSLERPLSAGSC